jgi:hypothetical protein
LTAPSVRIAKVVALIALFTVLVGAVDIALAAKTIYKCTKDGHVTLTDKPCDDAKASDSASSTAPQSGATTIASSSNPSPVGKWAGQEQFHGVENGEAIRDAHTVVPGTIEFSADGKVSGSSPENGCTLLGVWSQGGPATLVWLDFTLDGCRYEGLNRRYHGSLILARPDSSGELSAQALENPHLGQMKARMFDIKGTLRR